MKPSSPFAVSKVIDRLNNFLENRQKSEKTMILVFVFLFVLVADYYLLLSPVIHVFTTSLPELGLAQTKLAELKDDRQNREAIHKQWIFAHSKVSMMDQQFIVRNEVPSLLEKLSKMAQDNHLKIINLKPMDTSDAGQGFLKIPIRMSAVANTHDLGSFLSQLETGSVFFKVTNVRITANVSDEHRHTAELDIETYAKSK